MTEEEGKKPAIEYVHTSNVPELFSRLGITLLVSTYQAQRIMCLSPGRERLSMLMRVFPRPTGMALGKNRLAICCQHLLWIFNTATNVQDMSGNKEPNDVWFVPRRAFVLGDILAHEMALIDDEYHIVNTRFSTICKPSEQWSFENVWKPKFISKTVPEDRCHLNGMACEVGKIRYVSALAETDQAEGWREKKIDGGILMDYDSGEIVARGFCMPHSPRLYMNRLWILDSGRGMLKIVDPSSSQVTEVREFPGYLRGLAFFEQFAFIGLCKIREKSTFGGLPIEEKHQNLPCAIHIVNLKTGQNEGFIEFTKGIEEIFDIHVLAGVQKPEVVGFEEDTVKGLFILNPSQQAV